MSFSLFQNSKIEFQQLLNLTFLLIQLFSKFLTHFPKSEYDSLASIKLPRFFLRFRVISYHLGNISGCKRHAKNKEKVFKKEIPILRIEVLSFHQPMESFPFFTISSVCLLIEIFFLCWLFFEEKKNRQKRKISVEGILCAVSKSIYTLKVRSESNKKPCCAHWKMLMNL